VAQMAVEPYVRSKGKVTAGHSNAVTVNGSRRQMKGDIQSKWGAWRAALNAG
jgi:hypothetical protein